MSEYVVLHTIADISPCVGGPARSVPQLCQALLEQGIDVHLAALHPHADATHAAPRLSAERVHALGTVELGPLSLRRSRCGLANLVQRLSSNGTRPLIVHDHGIWLPCNHVVAMTARQLGLPRVVSPRGMLEPWALGHHRWRKRIALALYQRRDLEGADLLHATADSEACQFHDLGLCVRTVTIPNGIELPGQMPEKTTRAMRTRRALFLGRVHPKKGLPMLAEAWAQVQPSDWQMQIVGPNEKEHRQDVEQQLARLEIRDEWEFRPLVDGPEKWGMLAAADLVVLPSHSENFGLVVAESLAAGTPVLTTTAAPWSGLIERECGWWVEPTVDGLASGLAEATATTEEVRATMGRRGSDWVKRDFSWPGIARRMADAYRSLAA